MKHPKGLIPGIKYLNRTVMISDILFFRIGLPGYLLSLCIKCIVVINKIKTVYHLNTPVFSGMAIDRNAVHNFLYSLEH